MAKDKDTIHSNPVEKQKANPSWFTRAMILIVLCFVGYQIYSGVFLKKISIPLLGDFEFYPPTTTSVIPNDATYILDRNFIIGRWETRIQIGQNRSDSVTEYFDDSSFTSTASEFFGALGQRQKFGGTWDFEPLSENRFRLNMWDDNGAPWQGIFRALNKDEVQNMDQNYIAIRVAK